MTASRPMIPLAVPNLGGAERQYLAECIDTTYVSSVGPFVTRFEQQVSASAGAAFGVATSSGTTGLQAALVAAGVRPGDLVIMPSLTFIATMSAVHWAGARPWLCDVTAESWTMDAVQLEAMLARETENEDGELRHKQTHERVSAVLPVYTLGTPADMDTIVRVARGRGLAVIADAAAALGATCRGRALAQMGADSTMISFNGNKTVTAGGGGVVVGNDPALMKRLRHLTTTARVGGDYLHDEIGFNFRMTNLQAAVGVAQMEQLARFLKRKREIRTRYDLELAGIPDAEPFPQPGWAESACWFSGLLLNNRTADEMSAAIAALRERGIDARPFWRPMHLQPAVKDPLTAPTPVTDEIWFRILTLPCSTNLTDADQSYVIDSVRSIFAR